MAESLAPESRMLYVSESHNVAGGIRTRLACTIITLDSNQPRGATQYHSPPLITGQPKFDMGKPG